LDQPSLKFQNVSELAEFQISKSSSLVTCASDIYPLPTSINSSFSNSFIMEGEDENPSLPNPDVDIQTKTTQDIMDMNALFTLIKAHITDATQQLSGDVPHIADNNAKFKQEVKEELDEMQKVLAEQKRLLNIASPSPSPPPSVLNSTSTMGNPVLSTSNDTSGQITSVQALTTLTAPPQAGTTDVNSQMLMMLTESFSKLSTVLSEKSDTKSDWPKFSGDGKKF